MTQENQEKASCLADLLTDQDRAAGCSLWEDDHCVYLAQWGHEVAVFSSTGMTRASLKEFIDAWLNVLLP